MTGVGATPLGRVLPRRAASIVADALADTRVVLVTGARQCGKSTLVRVQARDSSAEWRNLDSAVTRQAAASDPTGFVDFGELMVIDEIQRVPELLLAIKEQVDAGPAAGEVPADRLGAGTRPSGPARHPSRPHRDGRAVAVLAR
ncbi:MAG TPA: AAA family ATPase [Pseudonocardiaceae bacterium]|nr:AAA family ATPase [Pseudonocardiaceae bacterium]